MNFGLTPITSEMPAPTQGSDFTDTPPFHELGVGRIRLDQIWCRKCCKPVDQTEQTGLNAGRRIILVRFYCHGEFGNLRICEDQLSPAMTFEVFEGEPALREPRKCLELPPKSARKAPEEPMDVQVEVSKGASSIQSKMRLQKL